MMPPAAGEKSRFAIFHNRQYLLFFLSRSVSLLGDSIHQIAIFALVYQLTHSPEALGNTLFFLAAPKIFFGLFSGVLADYWDRKKIMVAADCYRTLAVAAIPFVPSLGWVYFILATLSLVEPFYNTARVSLVPHILQDEKEMIVGNSFLQTATTVLMIVGPALGGFLVAALGTTPAFLIDGFSFFAAALLTLWMRVTWRKKRDEDQSSRAILRSIYEGCGYFVNHRQVIFLTMVNVLLTAGIFLTTSLRIAFADQFLSPGGADAAKILGYIYALGGVGSLIGGLLLPSMAARLSVTRIITLGVILTSLDFFCFAFSNNLTLILTAVAVSGWGFTAVNVSSMTLIQSKVNKDLSGRVLSFYAFILSVSAALAAVAGGWLGGAMGVKFVFLMAGLLCLAAAAVGPARHFLRVGDPRVD